jgi:Ca2+-binding EF-hand superfamily protein
MTDNVPNKSSSSTKIKPQPPSNNPLPTQSGNKKDEIPVFEDEIKATKEEVQSLLERILDKISSRFVKKYLPPMENILEDTQFFIPVEFYECKNKRPIPEHKVIIIFKVGRNLDKKHIFFQIENESVSYPLFSSINLSYFESIIDRVLLDKYKTSQALHLESNFESTRILNLNGETKKLYTILDKENIFLNNKSEYYRYEGVDLNFKIRTDDEILKLIKILWKTLVANDLKPMSVIIDELKKEKEKEKNNELNNATTGKKKKELKKEEEELFEEKVKKLKEERKQECENLTMSYSQFKLFFEYSKCEMSEENIAKLWKYTNKKKTETIQFQEFVVFAVYLIHSLSAFYIAKYKHEHNNCFENKINNCVNIMNYHFKEYDTDNNQEISFENLKKSLLKENELFTRKDIEIILRQINPESNFQYWKFDKILHILYYNHFNYQKLMEEDKIYNYLIQIFRKQDPHHVGKLHYKKMKLAFLTEDKIKFDKTEILILLAQFDIYKCPEIDYYQASLLLRNIVEYLLGSDIGMQKLNIKDNNNVYEDFEDEYDEYCQKVKEIFTKYDEDFDHILNKNEFIKFIKWLIHYIDEETIEELFNIMDQDKDGVLNYQEFKNGFKKLMEITRVRNVIKEIKTIKNEIKPENEGNNNINENEDNNKDINDNNDNAANNENNNDENKS